MSSALAKRHQHELVREMMAADEAAALYTPAPSFAHRPGAWSGVHRLIETPMEIAGVQPTKIAEYVAADATATTWPARVGTTMTLSGGGDEPAINLESPFLGPLDKGLRTPGKLFSGNLATTVGSDHVVVEAVVRTQSVVNTILSLGYTGGGEGFLLYHQTSGISLLVFSGGAARAFLYLTPGAPSCWVHYIAAVKWESATGFWSACNGTLGADTGNPTLVTLPLTAAPISTAATAENISYFAMWKKAGLLSARADFDEMYKRRWALIAGTKPLVGWSGDRYPVVAGSNNPTYQRKTTAGVTRLHYMGHNTPRFEKVTDADGREFVGALVEPGATNSCLQSQSLATVANWALLEAGDVVTNGTANGPDGSATLSGIKGSAVDTQHGVGQVITLTAAAWVYSVYARKGNKDWLQINNTSIANCYGYFNLATGAVGTKGAGATVIGIIPLGDGLYRCWMTFTGTAAGHAFRPQAAHADGDNTFAGDGATVNIHVGCAQAELGSYPTSYIITTTGSAARVADSLYYNLTNLIGAEQGAIRFRFLCPPGLTRDAVANHSLIELCRTDLTARLCVHLYQAADYVAVYRTPDNTTQNLVAFTYNNRIREAMVSWLGKRLDLWVDGVLATVTMTAPPTAQTRLYVASSPAAAAAGPTVVGDVKVFNRYQPSWATRGSGFRVV